MNYSDEIKSRISAREMFDFYGFEVSRAGFVRCPLHGEKTPSLKVYDGDRGWKCFGCGAGSSVIDFVMQYFGLSFSDAQSKLNDDFNLCLPIGVKLSRQEQNEARRNAEERKKRIKEREKRHHSLQKAYDETFSEYVRLAIVRESAPKSPQTPITDEFAFALRNITDVEYRLSEAESNLMEFIKEAY